MEESLTTAAGPVVEPMAGSERGEPGSGPAEEEHTSADDDSGEITGTHLTELWQAVKRRREERRGET